MTIASGVLRVVIALMGLAFFFGAVASGEVLWGFGVLSFFGVAFCSLIFSGLDPSAKSPEAKKWFVASMIFGVVALFILLLSAAMDIAAGDIKSAIKLLIYLAPLFYGWKTHGKEIKAIFSRVSNSQ